MNPFDFLNSINTTKEYLMDEECENEYKAFLINRGLSYFQDTVALSNEMNIHNQLENKLQYDYYINIVRPRKRFSKWFKKENDSDIELIQEYYGYSHSKALKVLSLFPKIELLKIKEKLEKGGL